MSLFKILVLTNKFQLIKISLFSKLWLRQMVIQKRNHQHHTHLRGASFLGFIMFWTFSFSYFTALKYVINILMNQKWTYLSRRRQLYQVLASYFGRLNLALSSRTFNEK